jgi:hypothetical protein
VALAAIGATSPARGQVGDHDAAEPHGDPDQPHEHGEQPPAAPIAHPADHHDMWMQPLGGGWQLMGMGQFVPLVSFATAPEQDDVLERAQLDLTQPAAMLNVTSPASRFAFRLTPNFEALSLSDGEVTFGAWGEGFLDARHPHTLLHEAMVSLHAWETSLGSFSVSAGRGFAPYGTDDPMARPALKYPTNHHLSQILERWTLNGVALFGGWGAEAGLFGGAEPEHPYDVSNIREFGDSFSGRLSRRFGQGFGPMAPWELSASYARVREPRHEDETITHLFNAAGRHLERYGAANVYALAEASISLGDDEGDYVSVLAETQLGVGPHLPYYRIELATRPEYERDGPPGSEDFFRYDHDAQASGATRWLINTIGYTFVATELPLSARPFVELAHHHVRPQRGGIEPRELFGSRQIVSASVGVRLYLGGGPMRMGSYGVLDPMTVMHRQALAPAEAAPPHHHAR